MLRLIWIIIEWLWWIDVIEVDVDIFFGSVFNLGEGIFSQFLVFFCVFGFCVCCQEYYGIFVCVCVWL